MASSRARQVDADGTKLSELELGFRVVANLNHMECRRYWAQVRSMPMEHEALGPSPRDLRALLLRPRVATDTDTGPLRGTGLYPATNQPTNQPSTPAPPILCNRQKPYSRCSGSSILAALRG